MYSEIADVYHEIFPLNTSFINFIARYLGPAGSRILDIGCGPGDYIHNFSANYEGVGIDADKEMIRLAKSKNTGTFFQMTFDEIGRLNGPFSCIFSIGNSLSYLADDQTSVFFKIVYQLLTHSGSYFVLQVVNWDKYRLTGKMDFPIKILQDGRTFHRGYAPSEKGKVLFNTRLQDEDKILGSWSDALFPKTMDRLVSDIEHSGLTVVSRFGDFEKSEFTPESSPAIVIVARKNSDA